jgi:hypothetical protein
MVSFKPRSLYFRGKNPQYPVDSRLGGTLRVSGRYGEMFLAFSGIEPQISWLSSQVLGQYTDRSIPGSAFTHTNAVSIQWVEGLRLKSQLKKNTRYPHWIFPSFPQSPHANSRIVTQLTPLTLPLHYLRMSVIWCYAVWATENVLK